MLRIYYECTRKRMWKLRESSWSFPTCDIGVQRLFYPLSIVAQFKGVSGALMSAVLLGISSAENR